MPVLLDVRDVSVRRGALPALTHVSLTVGPGEIVAVVGASGAGKTTLLRTVAGQLVPAVGSIRLRGEEVGGLPPRVLAERGVLLVDDPALLGAAGQVPALILVDDLTAAADPVALLDALHALNSRGAAVLIADAKAAVAVANSDRAYVLTAGRVTAAGTSGRLAVA